MCGLDYLIAQRYGKGRAAHRAKTKPPNLEKNKTSKPPRAARPFDRLVGLID